MRQAMFVAVVAMATLWTDISIHAQTTPSKPKPVSAAELVASARSGDTEAQFAVASLILLGRLPNRSTPELRSEDQALKLAVTYLNNAIAKGNLQAQYLLGTQYLQGRGVKQDLKRAKDLFHKAAQAGDDDAQNALAQMLRKGQGGPRDDKAAVGWFEKSAAQGNKLALTNLGYMYMNGLGVAVNVQKAIELTRRAADTQVPEAQHNLGWMYHYGKGVTKDSKEAVRWYLLAADQGYAPSQLNAGFLFAKGEAGGDTRDQLVEAVKWFALAAVSGTDSIRDTAKKALVYVAERVPPEVMLDGRDAAQKWAVRHQSGGHTASLGNKP